MPAVPNIASTGAAIFGVSDESGKDTTGAAIFDVSAPRSVRPQLGAMSGWDDAFDRKFDSAALDAAQQPSSLPGDPYDPFAAPGGYGVNAFLPAAPSSLPNSDAFGQVKYGLNIADQNSQIYDEYQSQSSKVWDLPCHEY